MGKQTKEKSGGVTPSQIVEWCESRGIRAELIEHPAIGQTNEEASRVLKIPMERVLKSIVFQASPGGTVGAILQGANRVDLIKVQNALRVGKPSLVPPGILLRSLHVAPGSVSPFLFAMNGISAAVDSGVMKMDEVFATAGSSTQSVRFSPKIFEILGYEISELVEGKGRRT